MNYKIAVQVHILKYWVLTTLVETEFKAELENFWCNMIDKNIFYLIKSFC